MPSPTSRLYAQVDMVYEIQVRGTAVGKASEDGERLCRIPKSTEREKKKERGS